MPTSAQHQQSSRFAASTRLAQAAPTQQAQRRQYAGMPPSPAASAATQAAPPPPATSGFAKPLVVSTADAPVVSDERIAGSQIDADRVGPSGRLKPGYADDANFEQHWSVARWRGFNWPPKGIDLDTSQGLAELARTVARNAQAANMAADRTTAAYWAYHIARTGFFFSQAAAAVAAQAVSTGAIREGKVQWLGGRQDLGSVAKGAGVYLPGEAMGAYEQDLKCIKEGRFRLPWDMAPTLRNRQFNPLHIADQASRYIREAGRILSSRNTGDNLGKLPFGQSKLYPEYYQNNFHYQTDGWFSSDSAKVYDSSTESLFLGRQDAMQRATLVHLNAAYPTCSSDSKINMDSNLRFLEVGAGTGRFATFVRDNYPRARMTVSDLSPFYLQEAREAMAHYADVKQQRAGDLGETEFVQCAAEELPFEDGSFDAVYSVYMFHEMPTPARDAALAEMARVLKPGGTLVVTDSSQLGDRARHDANMANFKNLNEPHYPSFVEYNFGDAFLQQGLQPGQKVLQSVTKSLSATKPVASDSDADAGSGASYIA